MINKYQIFPAFNRAKRALKIINFKYITIILVIITFLIVVRTFAEPYRISGDCMEPAIKDGKFYFLNHISSSLLPYQIGDIVVFKYDERIWISRIVALEGDIIQITKDGIMLNNVLFKESAVHRNWVNWKRGTYAIDKPFLVPVGHVFVLSDNLSAQHDDSRVFRSISKISILGRVW